MNELKTLKTKIAKLENENAVLFNAMTLIPDFAAGIMLSLKADEKIEAMKKAEHLQAYALNAASTAKGGPGVPLPR